MSTFYSVVNEYCIINEGGEGPRLLHRSCQQHPPSSYGPFAIYAVEIHTQYSKICLKKNFADFARLQKILSQLGDTKLEKRDA
jgi:hypothetical protein